MQQRPYVALQKPQIFTIWPFIGKKIAHPCAKLLKLHPEGQVEPWSCQDEWVQSDPQEGSDCGRR